VELLRATVIANADPQGQGRLQVRISSSGSVQWAPRVIPIAAFTAHDVPLGAAVWVAFEEGEPEQPVVLGLVEPLPRREALSRDLEAMGDAWDQGHAAGSSDADGGATPNPYR
jgi:hypothetical protein